MFDYYVPSYYVSSVSIVNHLMPGGNKKVTHT